MIKGSKIFLDSSLVSVYQVYILTRLVTLSNWGSGKKLQVGNFSTSNIGCFFARLIRSIHKVLRPRLKVIEISRFKVNMYSATLTSPAHLQRVDVKIAVNNLFWSVAPSCDLISCNDELLIWKRIIFRI